MAGVDLFKPQTEDEIKKTLIAAKKQGRELTESDFELSIAYLDNKQRDDIVSQLQTRYKQTQAAGQGQRIEPVTLPITSRYASEASSIYSKTVKRRLIRKSDDTEDEEASSVYNDCIEESGNDEKMHRVEQVNETIETCCVWYQVKGGKLHPVVTYPHHVYPIAPLDPSFMDPANFEDYDSFIIAINWTVEDASNASPQTFARISKSGVQYYEARDPYTPDKFVSDYDNPFKWPQVIDKDGGFGEEQLLPLQMLTFWHKHVPVNELIPDVDPDIVFFNRELNIQVSVLLDTLRVQGWSQLFLNLQNPDVPPSRFSWGSRFAMGLGPGESASFLSAPNSYTDMMNSLKEVVKLEALAHRMSPTDFTVDGPSPASGFAKLVDSLPKLESRRDKARRYKYMEEQVAYPRIASILEYLGKLKNPTDYYLRVEFEDIEFPKSVGEIVQQKEFEFKYGIDSPARMLSKKLDISTEEARELIAENKGQAQEEEKEKEQQQAEPRQSAIGQLIGRARGLELPKP
jgi:hypothetical protein